jgi:glyoxylase-like metal-dependent hydrolase (beta-lactamase superfamily II)
MVQLSQFNLHDSNSMLIRNSYEKEAFMSDMPASTYVASRQFGEATVTVISDGSIRGKVALPLSESEWRPAIPEADAEGMISYGLNFLHIQIGDASIVVDPSGLDDPTSGMIEDFVKSYPSYTLTPGLEAGLASIGVGLEDVTHLLITHGHLDHFRGMVTERAGQQVPRFPNARYLVGAGDWDSRYLAEKPDGARMLCYGTVERAGQLETVAEDREFVPGVTMIPAPGESPGHCIIRVRSGGESFYYLGDLFHYAAEVEHLAWMDPGRNAKAMRPSRERLLAEVGDTNAILLYTHSPFPGWGRIVSSRAGYRWQWA